MDMISKNKSTNYFFTPYVYYFIYAITGLILMFIFKNDLKQYNVTYAVLFINSTYIIFYTYLVYLSYSLGHHLFAWFIAVFPSIALIITLTTVFLNIKNGKETVILDGPEIIVNNKTSQTLSTFLHSKTAFDAWLRIIAEFL